MQVLHLFKKKVRWSMTLSSLLKCETLFMDSCELHTVKKTATFVFLHNS